VLAGNHTLRAATQLKWDAIAVVWTDDDELFAKARALADNKTAELGSSDEVLLGTMLADIAAKPELLAVVAFSDKELQRLLTKAVATDSDEFPEYDETSADQVKMLSCPQCECEFPA
jgi:ParB-like chromosome segregation protein Spo0J